MKKGDKVVVTGHSGLHFFHDGEEVEFEFEREERGDYAFTNCVGLMQFLTDGEFKLIE